MDSASIVHPPQLRIHIHIEIGMIKWSACIDKNTKIHFALCAMWHNTGWQPCVRSDDGFLICGSSSNRFSPRRTLNATASIAMSCSCSQMAFWDISTCILQSASLRCFNITMFNICWCDLRACVSDGVGTKVVQLSEHSRLPPPPHRLVSPPSCWNGSKDDHDDLRKNIKNRNKRKQNQKFHQAPPWPRVQAD